MAVVAIERVFSRSTVFDTERRGDGGVGISCLFSAAFIVDWHSVDTRFWFDRFSIGVLGWFSRSSAVAGYE